MSHSAMSARLAGKTVLITGASSGIGRSTAIEFSRTSPTIRLIVTARREEVLKELAATIEKESIGATKVLSARLDVSDPADVKGFLARLPEEWRGVDVLVNNAYASVLPRLLQCADKGGFANAFVCSFATGVLSKVLKQLGTSQKRTLTSCSPQMSQVSST